MPHRSQRSRGQERQATNGAKRFTLNKTKDKKTTDNTSYRQDKDRHNIQVTSGFTIGVTQREHLVQGVRARGSVPGTMGAIYAYKGWHRNRCPSACVDTSQHHQDSRLSYCGCHVHRAWLLGIKNWIPWAKKAAGTGDKTARYFVTLIEQHEQACTQPDGARLAAYNRRRICLLRHQCYSSISLMIFFEQ